MSKTSCLIAIVVSLSAAYVASPTDGAVAVLDNGGGALRDDYNGAVGFGFRTPSTQVEVTALGFYDLGADGLASPHRVGLWRDSDRTLLGEVTLQLGSASRLEGDFRFENLGSLVLLDSNSYYTLGVEVHAGGGDLWRDQYNSPQPTMDSNLVSNFHSRYVSGAFAYPIDSGAGGLETSFGSPNFEGDPFIPTPTSPTVVSLDFNVAGSATMSGHQPGGINGQTGLWNVLNVPGPADSSQVIVAVTPVSTTELTSANGYLTDVVFTYFSDADSGNPVDYRTYVSSQGPNLRTDMVTLRENGPVNWEITGLLADTEYDLVLFGQGASGSDNPVNSRAWTVGGGSPVSTTSAGNSVILSVTSDASGTIHGEHLDNPLSEYTSWSGLQIYGVFDILIPEPSTLILLLLGTTGLFACSRRRRR